MSIILLYYRLVVAYISNIYEKRTFRNKEKNSDFTILKFMLNNNYGTEIQCNIYDETINIFENKLILNDVRYLFILLLSNI